MTHAEEDSSAVDSPHPVKILLRTLGGADDVAFDAGVVTQDVETTKVRRCPCQHGLHVLSARDVGVNRYASASETVGDRFLLTGDVGSDDLGTLSTECVGHGRADAGPRSRDYGHLALKP